LKELLDDDDKFGFIVMDGNGCLYGTLQGSTREVTKRHGLSFLAHSYTLVRHF
jgi:peptide subunit release factor 1 (eRF1)